LNRIVREGEVRSACHLETGALNTALGYRMRNGANDFSDYEHSFVMLASFMSFNDLDI
jgi:hypothetical protein